MWEVFFYFYHVLTFRYNLNKRNNNMAFLITKMLSSHSCKKHYIASNDSHSYSFYMHTSWKENKLSLSAKEFISFVVSPNQLPVTAWF